MLCLEAAAAQVLDQHSDTSTERDLPQEHSAT